MIAFNFPYWCCESLSAELCLQTMYQTSEVFSALMSFSRLCLWLNSGKPNSSDLVAPGRFPNSTCLICSITSWCLFLNYYGWSDCDLELEIDLRAVKNVMWNVLVPHVPDSHSMPFTYNSSHSDSGACHLWRPNTFLHISAAYSFEYCDLYDGHHT